MQNEVGGIKELGGEQMGWRGHERAEGSANGLEGVQANWGWHEQAGGCTNGLGVA